MTRLEKIILDRPLTWHLVIATGARFWSLKGVLAICAVLIFAGWLTDWILVKRQKEAVFSALSRLRNKLAQTPILQWQLNTAKGAIRLWEMLLGFVDVAFLFSYLFLSGRSLKSYAEQRLRPQQPDENPFRAGLADFFKRGVVFLLLMALWWVAIFTIDLWFVKVSSIIAVTFLLGVLATKMSFEMGQQLKTHIHRHSAEGARHVFRHVVWLAVIGPFSWLVAVIFLSIVFSVAAIGIGCAMANAAGVSSYWFNFTTGGAVPSHPLMLVLVNFLFDLFNVSISVAMLTIFIKKDRGFIVVVMIGVALSTILTILKYTMLKIIAGSPGSVWIHFSEAYHWLLDLMRLKVSSLSPDWPLTPVLLTSFIIVTTYVAAFILLGFVLKPLTKMAGHICEVMGQNKEKTPFLQISILLTMLVAVVKALSEWDWLIERWPF